jgi:hypothetical protein
VEGSLSGGEAGGASVDAEIDVDLSDAIENIDSLFGLMAHVEAGRGPLTVFADVLYLSVEADRDTRCSGEANVGRQGRHRRAGRGLRGRRDAVGRELAA